MPETRTGLHIVGRHGSLFTRIPRFLAEALGVPYGFDPVMDLAGMDPAAYGGNPALKLPVLRIGEERVFGALNISRRIAREAGDAHGILWPEDLQEPLLANAHELVFHCMNSQVQLVMGLQVCGLPADNPCFLKAGAGLRGSLQWLDDHLPQIDQRLPPGRQLSYLEVALFCLLEHLSFRRTMEGPVLFPALDAFRARFSGHAAAANTRYRHDDPAAIDDRRMQSL